MPPHHTARVLVADDQADVVEALRLLLDDEGHRVETAASPGEAARALESEDFDVALIDLNYTRDTTSGQEGLDLLERIRAMDPALPDRDDRLEQRAERGRGDAARRARLHREAVGRRPAAGVRADAGRAAARAAAQRSVLEERTTRLQRAPDVHRRVVRDEGGARDDRARRAVRRGRAHHRRARDRQGGRGRSDPRASAAANRPLVTMNAGGLAEGVAESELFGHVKGAFTDARADRIGCFELADDGTLFLDEIANMPVALQAKLLRVLQTGEVQRWDRRGCAVNVRVLSATNATSPTRWPRAASARTCSTG